LCRDVNAAGYGFSEALAYWVREGRPTRMDADGNGIPCETVYPSDEVTSALETIADYEPGLYCRDLADRADGFGRALTYWVLEGAPDRMDADGNGIPCETVYDGFEIDDFVWFDR
jgi:hypothetical protein